MHQAAHDDIADVDALSCEPYVTVFLNEHTATKVILGTAYQILTLGWRQAAKVNALRSSKRGCDDIVIVCIVVNLLFFIR